MRRIGIVGSEGAKFTPMGEKAARKLIRRILSESGATEVVSGACHLGGVDVWAAEIGRELGLKVTEFPPNTRSWETGYKPRNLQIVDGSDELHCITVNGLADDFKGMRFQLCYHCGATDHVKSGGCWTMKQAAKRGQKTALHVVENVPAPSSPVAKKEGE